MVIDQQVQLNAPGVLDMVVSVFGVPPPGSATSPGLGGPVKPTPVITGQPGGTGVGTGGRRVINLQGNTQDQQPSGV